MLWVLIQLWIGCAEKDDKTINKTLEQWTLTQDQTIETAMIEQQTGFLRSDGGISLSESGTLGEKSIAFSLNIGGSTSVQINQALPISTVGVNTRFEIDSETYRCTSGNVIFTSYNPVIGGTLAGMLDIGCVSLDISLHKAIFIKGKFSITFT